MYSFMHNLLSDKENGIIFECFGIWHWLYLLAMVAVTALSIYYLKDKNGETRRKFTNYFITAAFCLYVLDFFMMPFAIEKIDVDKLPFHACTSMCVMSFWSNHNKILGKFRTNFAMLGSITNLMYIVYPSGVASYDTHPFSYRAVQTLLFHGVMFIYGVLVIVYSEEGLSFKKAHHNLVILVSLTCWALIGNALYSGESANYSEDFNWFFLEADPFGLLPESVAPYVAPFMNIAVFFAIEMIIYFVYNKVRKHLSEKDDIETAKEIILVGM